MEINPFDIVSGKVVQNYRGTFWFKYVGINIDKDDYPIYKNLHRLDGPAVIYRNGTKEWYRNGLLHREDGPARSSLLGNEEWWFNNTLHNLNGPAIKRLTKSGFRYLWYIHGKMVEGNYTEEIK